MKPKERLQELGSLLQVHLMQEYAKGSWIATDPQTHAYFRLLATSSKSPAAPPQQFSPVSSAPKPSVQKAPVQEAAPKPSREEIKPSASKETIPAPPAEIARSESFPPVLSKAENASEKPIVNAATLDAPAPKTKTIKRELLSAPADQDLGEIRKVFTEKFPHIEILEAIPQDIEAKQLASAWKKHAAAAEIVILSFSDHPRERVFLENLAAAIDRCLAPAKIIPAWTTEQENGWDKLMESKQLRLFIAGNYGIYTLPELMKRYREESKEGKHYISHVRLHLLSDISLYIQEPHLKANLWRTICEIVKKA